MKPSRLHFHVSRKNMRLLATPTVMPYHIKTLVTIALTFFWTADELNAWRNQRIYYVSMTGSTQNMAYLLTKKMSTC
jgi:hypothetical protein